MYDILAASTLQFADTFILSELYHFEICSIIPSVRRFRCVFPCYAALFPSVN
jgi:hypothetical protein